MKITRSFFFGILAALGALFLELLIGMLIGSPQDLTDIFFNQITPLLILAVLTEEILKFIFVYRSFLELKVDFQNINNQGWINKEVFLNSLFIGIGFSFTELLFILFGLPSTQALLDLGLAVSGILIIHTFTASVMGYVLANYSSLRFSSIPIVLLATTVIHLFYNSLIIYSARPIFVLFYLLFFVLTFFAIFLKANLKKTKKIEL